MSQPEEQDWRKLADVAQQEMVRHAETLIHSANLIRAELGHDVLALRSVRRPRRPLPTTDDERRSAMRRDTEQEYQRQSREGGQH
jgi:hypothetical protein